MNIIQKGSLQDIIPEYLLLIAMIDRARRDAQEGDRDAVLFLRWCEVDLVDYLESAEALSRLARGR